MSDFMYMGHMENSFFALCTVTSNADDESNSTLDTITALPVVVSQEQDTKNCQKLKRVRFTHATIK